MYETVQQRSALCSALQQFGLIVDFTRHDLGIEQCCQEMGTFHQKEAAFFAASCGMQVV